MVIKKKLPMEGFKSTSCVYLHVFVSQSVKLLLQRKFSKKFQFYKYHSFLIFNYSQLLTIYAESGLLDIKVRGQICISCIYGGTFGYPVFPDRYTQ